MHRGKTLCQGGETPDRNNWIDNGLFCLWFQRFLFFMEEGCREQFIKEDRKCPRQKQPPRISPKLLVPPIRPRLRDGSPSFKCIHGLKY